MLLNLYLLILFAQRVEFQPLTSGNQVTYNEFQINVPTGINFATEEHAHNMFPLLKMHDLPYAIGVYYSSNANWDWAVGVQYIPDYIADFTINTSDAEIQKVFEEKIHLHFLTELDSSTEVTAFLPATTNDLKTTFEVGLHYNNGPSENEGSFARKIIKGKTGTLVLIARIQKDAFVDRIEILERVFREGIQVDNDFVLQQSETVMQEVPFVEFVGVSYLSPELTPELIKQQEELNALLAEKDRLEAESENASPVNYWLLGGAFALLAIAFGLKSVMKKG